MAKQKRARAASKSASTRGGPTVVFVVGAVVAVLIIAAGGLFLLGGNDTPEFAVEKPPATDSGTAPAVASLPVSPQVGALAPDFTLSNTTGEQVSLSDFRGQPMVVTFFHTW